MLNFDFHPMGKLVALAFSPSSRMQITDGVIIEQTAIESAWFPNFDELQYKKLANNELQ